MMASKPFSNSSQKCSDDKMVIIDIYQKLKNLPMNEQNPPTVCISRVPKSLSSTNPECFIPQFVGLGPYHHFRSELTMTDEMKLCVANRVSKVKDLIPHSSDMFHKYLINHVFDIQSLYFEDVCSTYDSHTLLYLLTVDGLFLLGLFYGCPNLEGHYPHQYYYYILTGRKQGMPLINHAGVELTTNGVIGDVFVLENQIPTLVLKHLNRININSNHEFPSCDEDLGLAMQNLCERFCPLVQSESLSNNPEAYDHLLGLMYHMITPELELDLEPEPEPEHEVKVEPKPKFGLWRWTRVCSTLSYFIFVWTLTYYILLVFSLFRSLFGMVKWVLTLSSGKLVNMPSLAETLGSRIDMIHETVSRLGLQDPYAQIIGQIQEKRRIRRLLQQRQSPVSLMKFPTIPSAIELHSVGVRFQPAEGGISSFKFDNRTRSFYLPSVRFDANFEVIVRNLLAYESLNKSHALIFTRYIELMSILMRSAEDVMLLVDENIIQTRLSHKVVAQTFTGLVTESNGITKFRKLEEEIYKVNIFYHKIMRPRLFWTTTLPGIGVVIGMLTIATFVVNLLVRKYCNDNHASKLCKLYQVGDYGTSNYFISSM